MSVRPNVVAACQPAPSVAVTSGPKPPMPHARPMIVHVNGFGRRPDGRFLAAHVWSAVPPGTWRTR
jgi:hypothetical protein